MFPFAEPGEIWKPIPGVPRYYVSDLGRVASVMPKWPAGRLLKPALEKEGYFKVFLAHKNYYVQRLVALAFHGEPPIPTMDAAHDDGVRTNNRAENIFWKTRKDNEKDKHRHGTSFVGERNPQAKLTEPDIIAIRYSIESAVILGKRYDVHPNHINKIQRVDEWEHV